MACDSVGRVVGARLQDPPRARRGAENREVGLAVAVVVAGHRDVGARTPRLRDVGRVVRARLQDPPRPGRGPEDREVGLAVAVVVAGHGNVGAFTPRLDRKVE